MMSEADPYADHVLIRKDNLRKCKKELEEILKSGALILEDLRLASPQSQRYIPHAKKMMTDLLNCASDARKMLLDYVE